MKFLGAEIDEIVEAPPGPAPISPCPECNYGQKKETPAPTEARTTPDQSGGADEGRERSKGLLTENRIFKERNVDIAKVALADAWGWGFSGVMVRASGAAFATKPSRDKFSSVLVC